MLAANPVEKSSQNANFASSYGTISLLVLQMRSKSQEHGWIKADRVTASLAS